MFERLPIHDDAAVENTRVLVEFPTVVVVAFAGVFLALCSTSQQAHSAAAKIVMKRMGQTDRLIFGHFPARVETADVIRDISRQKAVLPPLNLLFQSLTIVRERRLLVSRQSLSVPAAAYQEQDCEASIHQGQRILSRTPINVHDFCVAPNISRR